MVLVNRKIITNISLGLENCLAIKFVINRGEKYAVKFIKIIGIDPPTRKPKIFSRRGKDLKSGRETNHHYEK